MVAAARRLAPAGAIHVLVAGLDCAAVAGAAAVMPGVAQVLLSDSATPNAETIARLLVAVGKDYRWIAAAHSLAARAALPRAAALLDAAWLGDVTAIDDGWLYRPVYAGAAIAELRPETAVTCLTVRATAFAELADATPALAAPTAPAPIITLPAAPADTRSTLLGRETAASHRPDLSHARIVVAGGRGVGSAEGMAQFGQLADHLGAALGASRAAVDAGFAPGTAQVGQTGKTVAPDIYFALGISGAIQHLAGIKDAKCIVAINKDPEAPIFQVADIGLVGDLFDALPALQAALRGTA